MKGLSQRIYPHIKNGRFYNFPNEKPEGFLLKTIPTFIYSFLANKRRQPIDRSWVTHAPQQFSDFAHQAAPLITWIGHSSFLVQINGVNIVTDPIFGDLTLLYRRLLPAAIHVKTMPRVDAVLISHNHRDHMDAATLLQIKAQFPDVHIYVPQGDKAWFVRRGFSNVSEHTWWDTTQIVSEAGSVKLTFLPAIHWSQRNIFDKNRSLWGSWLIEGAGDTIYFAGDTAYSDHFSVIADHMQPISIALMPIAPCEPRRWLAQSHIGPEEAVQAFLDLRARHFIPMHWGTFGFGTDSFEAPLMRLRRSWEHREQALQDKLLHVLGHGSVASVLASRAE